jgi:hypothetical protein
MIDGFINWAMVMLRVILIVEPTHITTQIESLLQEIFKDIEQILDLV